MAMSGIPALPDLPMIFVYQALHHFPMHHKNGGGEPYSEMDESVDVVDMVDMGFPMIK